MERYYSRHSIKEDKYLPKSFRNNGLRGFQNGSSLLYARARPFLVEQTRNNVTFYDTILSRKISPMDVLNRLEQTVLKRVIKAEVEDEEPLIVGLRSEVIIRVWGDDVNSVLFNSLEIHTESEKDVKILEWSAKREISGTARKINLKFLPKKIGKCSIILRSKISWFEDRTISLDIEGNNPLMSFSDGTDWPIAITSRPFDRSVFVAYIHHVSKFSEEGDFDREVARENIFFFNDIAVDNGSSHMAASVSGWVTEGCSKFRFQEVRLYTTMGGMIWTCGGTTPLFVIPVLHLTFDRKGRVLIAAHDAICRCKTSSGQLETKATVAKSEQFGTASRMTIAYSGEIIVLDAAYGFIHIFDEDLIHLAKFPVSPMKDEDTQNGARGLTGIAVDIQGFVLISDCIHNTIVIYKMDGTKVGFIESEWDDVNMPVDVGVSHDGHVFVADHANGCVKKFKYINERKSSSSFEYKHIREDEAWYQRTFGPGSRSKETSPNKQKTFDTMMTQESSDTMMTQESIDTDRVRQKIQELELDDEPVVGSRSIMEDSGFLDGK